MDPRTGHLVADFGEIPEDLRSRYVPIPATLSRAAARTLGKNKEATVSLNSGGKLARWAAEVRAWQAEKPTGKAAQRRLRQMQRSAEQVK